MGGSCRIYGKHKNVYNILITKPNKKRLPETIWSRWKDNYN